MFEILNLWAGFKEEVKLIDNNGVWLDALMGNRYLYEIEFQRYEKFDKVHLDSSVLYHPCYLLYQLPEG